MDALSDDLFYVVLEHIWSLNDLEALWLTNRRAARLCNNMSSKTLWRIAYRTCWADCKRHQEEEDGMGSPCDCNVVVPVLQEPESVPFKVRAWLYQRASVRSFGNRNRCRSKCERGCTSVRVYGRSGPAKRSLVGALCRKIIIWRTRTRIGDMAGAS